MNTNPFLSSTSSNNVFTSNLYSTTSNNIFKTNNNNNTYNPFKVNNNNISTNTTSFNNNNDIFSRIKTNISDNSNNNTFNNNNFLNNMNNPFRTNNNTNTFNSTFTNNLTNNNFSYMNQNMKIYNFSNGLSTKLPICETVGKTPITTFNHDIKIQKDYSEKNKINSIDYNNARIEYICVDENLKNFSVEEIRINDYINAKIQYFDKWSNNDFNPNNQSINTFSNNLTNNFLNNNNNINNNTNTFSIFNKNNLPNSNNGSSNTNPFLNNNNNNNIFNNNTNNNPFNNNNNINNNRLSFLNNNNTTNNTFNNTNNNPFNTSLNNNNKNPFNSNTTGLSFLNNNTINNTSNNNIFNNNNNNNNNNIFNRNNNIFNNNTSNIFNANNNNNIFNNTNQNPFNSIFNNNNNNNNNNLINNNNLVNNIFNYNSNNFIDKPFEEKIKDPTWVKRNVKIIDNKDLDNCFSEYINDISQVNLRVKEMQYFDFQEQENKLNEEEIIIEPKNLIFNRIMLASDEEILNYNKKKLEEKKKEEEKKKKEDNNENDDEDKDEKKEKTDDNNKYKRTRWEPINIRNYKEDELSLLNEKLENNITSKKGNNKKNMNKGNISGFAEASKILSNFDNNYVDFSFNKQEPKEYILPTEKHEFSKVNNVNSNKQSYRSSSFNKNMYNFRFNERNNNINIYNQYMNNQDQSPRLMNNDYNNQIFDINNIENIEESKNDNIFNNNNLINTISNKTTKINTDEVNRNLVILEEDINNENIIKNEIIENECKLIFIGDAGNINELRTPILIQFSSIILNNENILNFDLILDIITKNILSIEDIENKIKIPNKEDIYLKIDGKLYSKLTNTLININSVDKNTDEKNGNYYYIYYGFKLKQYPLLLNDIDEIDNKYMTNPKIEEILNPENNYDLKRINNFEIWNKYGKIIFVEPIDLSGKIIINDIIKINNGNIDLEHERVDKLKARAFLNYDFGEKLEGTFLENVKYILKTNKGTYVNYDNDNKILEYTINF